MVMEATSTKATTGSSIWRPQDWVPPSKSLPSNNSQTKDAKSFRSRTFTNQQWSSQEKATRPAELKYVAPIPSEKKKRNRQKKRKNISPSLESNPILASPKKKEARKTNGNVNEVKPKPLGIQLNETKKKINNNTITGHGIQLNEIKPKAVHPSNTQLIGIEKKKHQFSIWNVVETKKAKVLMQTFKKIPKSIQSLSPKLETSEKLTDETKGIQLINVSVENQPNHKLDLEKSGKSQANAIVLSQNKPKRQVKMKKTEVLLKNLKNQAIEEISEKRLKTRALQVSQKVETNQVQQGKSKKVLKNQVLEPKISKPTTSKVQDKVGSQKLKSTQANDQNDTTMKKAKVVKKEVILETSKNAKAQGKLEKLAMQSEKLTKTIILQEKSTKYDSPTIGSHKITDEETISQREIIQKVIQVEKSHQPRKENDEFSRKLGVRCDFDLVSAIKGDLDWYINKHAEAFRVFNEALLRFCANNAQSSNFYKQKEELCQKIVEKVVQVFPTQKVSIHPYGSTVIGTGLQKSDLDVCVGIGNCEGEEVEYAPTSSCKSKLGKIAKNLRTLLRHKYLTFAVIGRCKVPIIKIQLVPHLDDLEIDLNVNSFDGVFNSYLIKYYTLVDHRFVQLSLLVKYWAKELGLCDAQGGMLNSHSYQLMALHYLQCGVSPPILPNLQFLQPEIFNDDRDLEEVTLSSTTELPPVEIPAFEQNNASLGELLCGFFYYFSDFPWQTEAISIRNGAVVSRAEITEEKDHSLMYIQEPYQESNAARTMNRPPLFDWLLSSIEVAADLGKSPSFSKFFNRSSYPRKPQKPQKPIKEKKENNSNP